MRSYHWTPSKLRVSGDLMVWPHPRDVILYARSSYYYNNDVIIYLFLTLFGSYILLWSLTPKNWRNVCHHVTFLDVTSSCFLSLVPCLKFTKYIISQQKQVTDVNLVLKDSDTESENLSSLIQLSVKARKQM